MSELLKLLSASQIVAQIVSFLILLFVMRLFVWKRFLNILDSRKERISAELRSISEAQAEAARLKAECEQALSNIEENAHASIQKAVSEGRMMASAIKNDAEREAERIISGAKNAIKEEVAQARDGLRKEIVDLAIGAAEKVIEEKLTEEQDRKIVEEFLKKVNK